MATRFYYPSNSTAPITVTRSTEWDGGNTTSRKMVTNTSGSAMVNSTFAETSSIANTDFMLCQYISDPLAAQTISGTVKGRVRASESQTGGNFRSQCIIRLVDSTGGNPRVLYAGDLGTQTNNPTSEWATTLTNRQMPRGSTGVTLTSQTANAGDYLVVELGYRAHNTTSNATGTISLGDDAPSDLIEDEASGVGNNPWIEFSQTITFNTGPQTHQGTAAVASVSTVTADGVVYDPNAPMIVNKTNASYATATTNHTFNVPTGIQNGDVMIASFALNGNTVATPASGWTQHFFIEDILNPHSYVYYRVVTNAGIEPASYTWQSGTAVASAGGIIAFRRVDNTTPIEASAYDFSATTATNVPAPSVTTLTNKAMLVTGASGNSSTTTWTPPAGMIEQWDQGAGKSNTLASNEIISPAGATGTRTFVQSATREWNSWTIALKPAPSGPQVHHGSATITSASTVASSGKRVAKGSASVASASTVTGSGKIVQKASATIASASSVGATGKLIKKAAAAVVSASTVAATGKLTQRTSAAMASASTLSAAAKETLRASAAVALTSTVSVSAKLTQRASAAITSVSTVAASANTAKRASAAVASSSTITSAGIRVAKGTATVTSTSSVATVGNLRARGTATVASTSTVAATGVRRAYGAATVSAVSTTSATAKKLLSTSASLASASTVTTTAKLIKRASANVVSASAVTADGTVITPEGTVHQGSAAIASVSTVTSTAKATLRGTSAIASASTIAATGKRTLGASAAITSTSSLATTAKRKTYGSAAIASASTVASSARLIKKATASVTSQSTTTANAKLTRRGTATIASSALLGATARLSQRAQAAIASESVVTAAASVTFSQYFDEVDATFIPTLPTTDSYSNSGASQTRLPQAQSFAGVTAYVRANR